MFLSEDTESHIFSLLSRMHLVYAITWFEEALEGLESQNIVYN